MKKVLLTITIISIALVARSQRLYQPLRMDVFVGYSLPRQAEMNGGILFGLEPRYAITDKISLGLRVESTMTSLTVETKEYIVTPDAKSMNSAFVTGDYYFGKRKLRPYIGLGFGMVRTPSAKIEAGDIVVDGNNIIVKGIDYEYSMNTAFMPRAGIERGRIRAALEYNMMGKTESTTAGETTEIDQSYIGLKLGLFFGGNKSDRPSTGNSRRIPIK